MLACFDEIFSCTIVVFHTVVGEIKHIAVCLPACIETFLLWKVN